MNNCLKIIFEKKKKQTRKIIGVIFIALILVNICVEMMQLNQRNLNSGLLENNRLMLLQMFGHNDAKNTSFIDVDTIKKVENVLFVTESFPIVMRLAYENGEWDQGEDVTVHKIPRKYGSYVGIENMQDGIVYCPNGSVDSEIIKTHTFTEEYKSLDLKLEGYNGEVPQTLKGEEFVSEETFDKIMKCERKKLGDEDADIVYSTPEYLIGVDHTENAFKVEKALIESFPDYDVHVFYQANGLQSFVSGSKNMIALQGGVILLVLLVSFAVISTLLSSVIQTMEKNMMVLYLNGMTRKDITKLFYQWVKRQMIPVVFGSFLLAVVFYFVFNIVIFRLEFDAMSFLFVFGINVLYAGLTLSFIRHTVRVRIREKTSNEKITQVLRN